MWRCVFHQTYLLDGPPDDFLTSDEGDLCPTFSLSLLNHIWHSHSVQDLMVQLFVGERGAWVWISLSFFLCSHIYFCQLCEQLLQHYECLVREPAWKCALIAILKQHGSSPHVNSRQPWSCWKALQMIVVTNILVFLSRFHWVEVWSVFFFFTYTLRLSSTYHCDYDCKVSFWLDEFWQSLTDGCESARSVKIQMWSLIQTINRVQGPTEGMWVS